MKKKFPIVRGPDGWSVLTVADLPPSNTERWVARRKAEVVLAVEGGLLTLEDACTQYSLTVDEFNEWQKTFHEYGVSGLKATQTQVYRQRSQAA